MFKKMTELEVAPKKNAYAINSVQNNLTEMVLEV